MLEPGRTILLQLAGEQGAALLTKYPTIREDIEAAGTPKQYIKRHYSSWVEFASTKGHGDDINLVLVTGVDRTRDFAMMSYSKNDDDDDLTCGFLPAVGDTSASVWGTWKTTGFVHTSCGPKRYFSLPSTQATDSTPSESNAVGAVLEEYNQCTFIRYYTVRKRLGIPRVIKAGAGPHNIGPMDREDKGLSEVESPSSDSEPGFDIGYSPCDNDGGGGRSPTTSIESEPDIVAHTTAPVCSFSILPANSSIPIHLL